MAAQWPGKHTCTEILQQWPGVQESTVERSSKQFLDPQCSHDPMTQIIHHCGEAQRGKYRHREAQRVTRKNQDVTRWPKRSIFPVREYHPPPFWKT